ncbi:acetyltransferase (GNAT) family protein [Serratia fonticola]|uniref:Acetyltransferase (GNAT) family protein n=1 Tax=Serratia fonticola TaxID=47917 RepID=A0A542BI59_SERFO|nr:GNAT family N-acetyltransferase [Serratia fonticola]TQI78259.1 acetyltransferase (GNAT) family protein [Serratia fonticola]TQI94743.1 acetyltransferase (GNAT) family protein [Serratia fonticola]TVZ69241.1 acetyltransferase (GNAT) family protein [Serratia fonticola]
MLVTTRQATLEEIHHLYCCIPEFSGFHNLDDLRQRVADSTMLGLIAEIDGQPAGFKLGYQTQPGEFYSWLGAVLPAFRRQGVAQAMLTAQEQWAKAQGYRRLWVKTRNAFRGMLIMLISNDYQIFSLEKKGKVDDYRLLLEKAL